MIGTDQNFLEVKGLRKYFQRRKSWFTLSDGDPSVKAVDDVSFTLDAGESLGLVGESGCGKTTLGRTILRLIPPTSGEVFINGVNILKAGKEELRQLRRISRMIFQSLDAALNPRMKINKILEEPLLIHSSMSRGEREKRIDELLERVNLPRYYQHQYPHVLSGGEKRRISVARALAIPPTFLIADEPVSSLDVTIRAQIIQLLHEIQQEYRITMIVISHDLAVLSDLCTKIAVMYAGKIIEMLGLISITPDAFSHPYSRKLVSSVLTINPSVRGIA
jgi:oligopeptide transport system ATP-binding protein